MQSADCKKRCVSFWEKAQKNRRFSDKFSVKQFEELSSRLKIQFVGTDNSFKDLTNLRDKHSLS